jgi:hypothetical protein
MPLDRDSELSSVTNLVRGSAARYYLEVLFQGKSELITSLTLLFQKALRTVGAQTYLYITNCGVTSYSIRCMQSYSTLGQTDLLWQVLVHRLVETRRI